MTVVGDASVIVRAVTDKVRSDIKRAFSDAMPDVRRAGEQAGTEYSGGFSRGLSASLPDAVSSSLGRVRTDDAGEQAGSQYAGAFKDSLNKSLRSSDVDFSGTSRQAARGGQRAGDSFNDGFLSQRDDLARGLANAFDDADTGADRAGSSAGSRFGQSFETVTGSTLPGAVDNALGSVDTDRRGNAAGVQYGTGLKNGLNNVTSGIDFNLGNAFLNAERQSDNLGQAIDINTQRGSSRASQHITTLGNNIKQTASSASGWFGGIIPPSLAQEASRASEGFTKLYATGNLLGPAIAGLVGSISSLISGLFAMASAASQAVGALAVLPGGIAAIVQGFAALKIAFGGVGNAFKAGLSVADNAVKKLSTNSTNSARQIADAQKALARAYEDAARRSRDALQRIAEAERRLADAQQDALAAQRALNQAREAAAESLQQLGFDVEDAALAEERAAMRLEDAHAALVSVTGLPADDRNRREAELAFKEAELSYRQAKDRAADLAKEQEKAAEAGIDGTKEVVDAQKDIADANDRVAAAERAVAEAREGAADVAVQNARAISDAQERLARAVEDAAKSNERASTAQDKYNQAMAKLSPQARSFVRALIAMRDRATELRNAIGVDMFPKLELSLVRLVNGTFPIFQTQLRTTASIMGDMALGFTNAVTSAEGMSRLSTILQGNNAILDVFNKKNETGRTTFESLTIVILRLLEAIQPLTQRFAEWVATLIAGADVATSTADGMGRLTGFFEKSGDTAAQLGRIFGNLWDAIRALGSAATPAGQSLLDSFEKATASLVEMIRVASESGELQNFFAGVADNTRALGTLINEIGLQFLSLGDNKGIAEGAQGLMPLIDNVRLIGDALIEAGPALSEFATKMSEIFVKLSDSGQIEAFIDTLTFFADVVNDILSIPFVQDLMLWLGPIFGIGRALAFLSTIFVFIGKVALGSFVNLTKLLGVPGRIAGAFRALATGGGMTGAVNALRGVGSAAGATATATSAAAPAIATGSRTIGMSLRGVGLAFKAMLGPIGIIVLTLLPLLIEWLVKLYNENEGFRKFVDGIVNGFKTVVDYVVNFFKPILESIGNWFSGIFDSLQPVIASIGDWFSGIIDTLQPIIQNIGDWFAGVAETVGPVISTIGDKLSEFAAFIWPIIQTIGRFIGTVLVGYFQVWWAVAQRIFAFVSGAFRVVGNIISWVVNNIIKPAINVAINIFNVVKGVVEVIATIIGWAWQVAFTLIKWYVDHVVVPAIRVAINIFNRIKDVVLWVVDKIGIAWEWISDKIKWVIDRFIKPAIEGAVIIFNWLKDKIMWVVDKIRIAWEFWSAVIRLVIDRYIRPAIQAGIDIFNNLKNRVSEIIERIKTIWNDLGSGLRRIYEQYIKPPIDTVKAKFDEIKTKVQDVVDKAKAIFTTLADAPKEGVRRLITFINDKLIDNVNRVTSNFGLTIPRIPMPQFAEGGLVNGPGTGTSDSIIARVSNGEFVMREKAVRAIGVDNLNAMNKGARPFAVGGWDWLENIGNSLSSIGNQVTSWLGNGIGWALEKLINTVRPFYQESGFVGDFVKGILSKLVTAARGWGDRRQRETEEPEGSHIGGIGTGPWRRPIGSYRITSGYGARWGAFHAGIDLAGPANSDIYAASRARVLRAGWNALSGRTGIGLLLAHADNLYTYYGHLSRYIWGPGTNVLAGQKIGVQGNTGRSTGPHLHFETHSGGIGRTMNPKVFMQRYGITLAQGGVISPSAMGTLALLAEAGRKERVEPLDSRGLSARDYAIIKAIAAQYGAQKNSGQTFYITNYYPQAEPTSVTINRAAQFAAALGV